MTLALVVSSALSPADTRGWYGVRRAYAVTGIGEWIALEGLGQLVELVLLAATGYVWYADNNQIDTSITSAQFTNGYSTSAQWLIDNADTYVNETASGYNVNTSAIPDSVMGDLIKFGAAALNGNGVTNGAVAAQYGLDGSNWNQAQNVNYTYNSSWPNGTPTYLDITWTLNVPDNAMASIRSNLAAYPYVAIVQKWNLGYFNYNTYIGGPMLVLSTMPWVKNGNYWGTYGNVMQYGSNASYLTYNNVNTLRATGSAVAASSSLQNFCGNGWFKSAIGIAAATVSGVPSTVSAGFDSAVQDPSDAATISALISALRALNPQVSIPEEMPSTITSYDEYVSYTHPPATTEDVDNLQTQIDANAAAIDGLGADVAANTANISGLDSRVNQLDASVQGLDSQVQSLETDLTNLPQDLADALGAGATLADLLYQLQQILNGLVSAQDIEAVFEGMLPTVQADGSIKVKIEVDVKATLQSIEGYLQTIAENTTAILQDMANLDRSTADLNDLTGIQSTLNQILSALNSGSGSAAEVDLSAIESYMSNQDRMLALLVDSSAGYGTLTTTSGFVPRILNTFKSLETELKNLNTKAQNIYNDMANLDRSTSDLVDLSTLEGLAQDILEAIDNLPTAAPADLTTLEGLAQDIYDLLDGWPSYPAVSLATVEHWLQEIEGNTTPRTLDFTHFFNHFADIETYLEDILSALTNYQDEDSNVATIRGEVHAMLSDIDSMLAILEDWPSYPAGVSLDLSTIEDELNEWHNDFVGFWHDLDDYLDAVLYDLEHLSLNRWTPTTNPTPPDVDEETGIVNWEEQLNLTALRDAVTRLMEKFPFSTINNFVLILTALTRSGQAPVFDLPMPNPSDWSSPYMVNVDLSDWDIAAAVLRTGIMLWAIARVSRRTVSMWTREEGGGNA